MDGATKRHEVLEIIRSVPQWPSCGWLVVLCVCVCIYMCTYKSMLFVVVMFSNIIFSPLVKVVVEDCRRQV